MTGGAAASVVEAQRVEERKSQVLEAKIPLLFACLPCREEGRKREVVGDNEGVVVKERSLSSFSSFWWRPWSSPVQKSPGVGEEIVPPASPASVAAAATAAAAVVVGKKGTDGGGSGPPGGGAVTNVVLGIEECRIIRVVGLS